MTSNNISVSVIITSFNRKKMVARCINSVIKSKYLLKEIFIVDNASVDGTSSYLDHKFGTKIKVIQSKVNLLAGGGRNLGAKFATGKYLLFIDSDNSIDSNMIKALVETARQFPQVGILGPKMFYFSSKNIVWWAGSDINLWTSKTAYHGIGMEDNYKNTEPFEVGHVPNVFMIPKTVFLAAKGFDTKNFPMHYEESDLAERIKILGYKILCVPRAVTYHDTPLEKSNKNKSGFALNDKTRAFYNIRNRIIFMKRYGKCYPLFVVIFLPFFTTVYILLLLKIKRPELIKHLLLGVKDGLLTQFK